MQFKSAVIKKMAPRGATSVDRHRNVNKAKLKWESKYICNQARFKQMPFKWAVFCCPHKSWIHKNLTFYSFPKNSKLKKKWIVALKTRTMEWMDYHWQASDRVCSAHFPRGHYNRDKYIPTIFPRKDKKNDQIVWPIDISNLLKPKGHTVKPWKKIFRNALSLIMKILSYHWLYRDFHWKILTNHTTELHLVWI